MRVVNNKFLYFSQGENFGTSLPLPSNVGILFNVRASAPLLSISTQSQCLVAGSGFKTPFAATLATTHVIIASSNSSYSSLFFRVNWFFEHVQKPGILWMIITLVVIYRTIIVILLAMTSRSASTAWKTTCCRWLLS